MNIAEYSSACTMVTLSGDQMVRVWDIAGQDMQNVCQR